MKILLIEDDPDAAAYVTRGFREHGHVVDLAKDGRSGLMMATEEYYDALIVDRMLPRMDGLSVVKAVRSTGVKTPVIFLTTMDGIDDRVEGLESGGDDYLVKPFAFSELAARVNALMRRPPLSDAPASYDVHDLHMDLLERTVKRAGTEIDLQPQEFKLLEFLLRNADRVVTRTMLLEQVWGFHFEPRTNIVETNISRLRAKVDRDFEPSLIHTVRGAGYAIRTP